MKSKEISILVIASLILLPFLGGESFAQSNQVLTVTTEKESYATGEPVEVLGLVEITLADTDALIRVVSPMGNMIHLAQVDVETDGSFSETISVLSLLEIAILYKLQTGPVSNFSEIFIKLIPVSFSKLIIDL